MTLTLKQDITATQTTIDVNGADTIRVGSYRQLEDEVILIRAAGAGSIQPGETAWQRLTVDRGIENSEAVVHAAAVEMTTYSGGSGAGGVTVDNQSDPPESITTLVMGAAFGPEGTATVTGLDDNDSVTGALATVTVSAPEDDGSAEVAVQALASNAEAGTVFATASADSGAALVRNKSISATGTATSSLDASSDDGVAESRVVVLAANEVTVLAGVVARHETGVGDSLVITDGDGETGEPGEVLTADATLGTAWSPLPDPLTSAGAIVLSAGAGNVLLTLGADGSFEVSSPGVVRLLNLPTADPVSANQLWNDAGTLKVSVG